MNLSNTPTSHDAPLKVLLVEDSALLRHRIEETVADDTSISIIGFAEGEDEALQKILQLLPDVVVLDFRLNQGDGLSMLRRLREVHSDTALKIVLFTNYRTQEILDIAEKYAVDLVLDKHFEFGQLPIALCLIAQSRRGAFMAADAAVLQ